MSMSFFKRRKSDFRGLQQFALDHEGVEGYLEPQTTTKPPSLLLVDRNGKWIRASVADRGQAGAFCKRLGIPVYDAAVVGYPKILSARSADNKQAPSPQDLDAWFALEQDEATGDQSGQTP